MSRLFDTLASDNASIVSCNNFQPKLTMGPVLREPMLRLGPGAPTVFLQSIEDVERLQAECAAFLSGVYEAAVAEHGATP